MNNFIKLYGKQKKYNLGNNKLNYDDLIIIH